MEAQEYQQHKGFSQDSTVSGVELRAVSKSHTPPTAGTGSALGQLINQMCCAENNQRLRWRWMGKSMGTEAAAPVGTEGAVSPPLSTSTGRPERQLRRGLHPGSSCRAGTVSSCYVSPQLSAQRLAQSRQEIRELHWMEAYRDLPPRIGPLCSGFGQLPLVCLKKANV